MRDSMSDSSTATERLIAFESRYLGRHAEEHASDCQLDERKVHDARVFEKYGKMKDNTRKTFHGFCGRWISFCESKGYDMLNTTAEIGQEFLEQERLRHTNPGDNLKIAFTQFKRLCAIRGCPSFNSEELFYMAKEVSEARKASADAALTRPVDEDRSCEDRSIITSAELQQLLRVCAGMPDRLKAARAEALLAVNVMTGERSALQIWLCAVQSSCLRVLNASQCDTASAGRHKCGQFALRPRASACTHAAYISRRLQSRAADHFDAYRCSDLGLTATQINTDLSKCLTILQILKTCICKDPMLHHHAHACTWAMMYA